MTTNTPARLTLDQSKLTAQILSQTGSMQSGGVVGTLMARTLAGAAPLNHGGAFSHAVTLQALGRAGK